MLCHSAYILLADDQLIHSWMVMVVSCLFLKATKLLSTHHIISQQPIMDRSQCLIKNWKRLFVITLVSNHIHEFFCKGFTESGPSLSPALEYMAWPDCSVLTHQLALCSVNLTSKIRIFGVSGGMQLSNFIADFLLFKDLETKPQLLRSIPLLSFLTSSKQVKLALLIS